MGMSEVLEYVKEVVDAEHKARRAKLVEPDDKKFFKLVKDYDALLGGVKSGISRPHDEPASEYTSKDAKESAASLQMRSVFALARYQEGKGDLYRAWIGDTEEGPRGEAMTENLFISEKKDGPQVVARYSVCFTCMGSMKTRDGDDCPDCSGGWAFDGGTKIKKLGKVLEVKKVKAPTDKLSKPAYDLITDPE